METKVGKFTFAVPGTPGEEGSHPDAGKKIEKPFEYQVCNTLEEAQEVLASRKWNVVDMVNDVLKANARSNAYQAALLPYKPSEVTPDEIAERMVRDYIRMGIPEEAARAQIAAMRAAASQAQA